RIFLNNGGTFSLNPQYTSTSTSVVEVIVCVDVDKDADQQVQKIFINDTPRKLYYFPRTPLQEINRVIVGADTLQFNEYCYDLESGWVILASAPSSGVEVTIEALVSWDLDMGITNWDQNQGNFLFYNTTNPVGVSEEETLPEEFVLYQNYPNPFNPSTTIKFSIPTSGYTTLTIYNTLGEEVAELLNKELTMGTYKVEWNASGLPSGIYFYQLKTEGFVETKKMLLLK
ncbi:MAG: T9SS type A sorting domain-containing protein, partial [Ignavibacteriaceae bacterium]|nr:T9SS type A sorting domain-containing protein [Ignavibacteriaceae bacterium]